MKNKKKKTQVGTNSEIDIRKTVSDQVKKERTTGKAVFRIQKGPESMTAEAYKWYMDKDAIPGAMFAPCRFASRKTVEGFFTLLGHPLTLEEIKLLVQPDGGMETCAVDGIRFQPVRYVPFVNNEAEEWVKNGNPLEESKLYYGGAFYQSDNMLDGKVFAVSGSVLNAMGYEATGSPLVIMATRLGEHVSKRNGGGKGGRRSLKEVWGESRARIEGRMQRRVEGKQAYDKRVSRVDEIIASKTRKRREPVPLNNGLAKLELNPAPTS